MNYLEISILFFFILFLILFYISNYIYNLFIIQQENINDEAFNTYDAEFDCAAYRTRYPDVKNHGYYGRNCDTLKQHYDRYGKREGRNPRSYLPAPNTSYTAKAGKYSDSQLTRAKEEADSLKRALALRERNYKILKQRNDAMIRAAKASVKEISDWESERAQKFKNYHKMLLKIRHYISMQRRRLPRISNTLLRMNGDITSESNNARFENPHSYASHMFDLEKNLSTLNQFMDNQDESDEKLIKLFDDVAKIVNGSNLN